MTEHMPPLFFFSIIPASVFNRHIFKFSLVTVLEISFLLRDDVIFYTDFEMVTM